MPNKKVVTTSSKNQTTKKTVTKKTETKKPVEKKVKPRPKTQISVSSKSQLKTTSKAKAISNSGAVGIVKKSVSKPLKKPRIDRKYSKMINNLLNIKGRDQALFTTLNPSNFDVDLKFGEIIAKKILLQKELSLIVREQDLDILLKQVQKAVSANEIIKAYESAREKISKLRREQLRETNSFKTTKKVLVESLETKIMKSRFRWQIFTRKVYEANIQENIWQLHAATGFISINGINNKSIYAPLLLKPMNLEIADQSMKLISLSDSWKINEKLIFMLNEIGFNIPENIDLDGKDAYQALERFFRYFKIRKSNCELSGKFVNKKNSDIKNSKVEFHSGVILGMFKPSGGNLRKTLLEIITNDEVDTILDPEVDKQIYIEKVNDFVCKKSDNLVKIQSSNFSQDKALISSLLQDTIIWGPPGTGKSQVIANIIANILYQNKTAIVMSQKKVALDILKKRLGSLAPFVLFVLNDNKMDKDKFYKPLQFFVSKIEYGMKLNKEVQQKLITKEAISALEFINKLRNDGSYDATLQLLNNFDEDLTVLENLYKLDFSCQYPKLQYSVDELSYQKLFASLNDNSKKNNTNNIKIAWSLQQINPNMDLNQLINKAKQTSLTTIRSLKDIPDQLKHSKEFSSDEEFLMNHISKFTLEKIKNWQRTKPNKYQAYQKFASSVRAGRSLSFKLVNDHANIIKDLFPIIITTPDTAFINWKKNSFDYAILDESSQIFIEVGLPILYLAKIKILAGDNQQLQPSRWFTTRDENFENEDIAENAESILNYALDKGVYQIMLDQNFRSSAASLMSFSSKHFYNSDLGVVDKKIKSLPNQEISPPIIVHNVNGKWVDSINELEAMTVIKILREEVSNYESIIVLTFNLSQREYIQNEIINNHSDLFFLQEQEKIMIRNIENVQGDEADLVIMSVVYDFSTTMNSTYVARAGGKNALNVAISRAKEKLIVVKSITADTLNSKSKSDDLSVFRQWLMFLDLDQSQQRLYSIKENISDEHPIPYYWKKPESLTFEEDVFISVQQNIAHKDGFEVIKNFEVGSNKIDLAIINSKGDFKIGVELDNLNYDTSAGRAVDEYLTDLSRQNFLESKGYPIYRITEIEWKMNKHKVQQNLRNYLRHQLLYY